MPITEEPLPPNKAGSGGLSGGAIFGIIFGVIVFLAIAAIGVFCLKSDKAKEISLPSFSGLSVSSSTKKQTPTPSGFDNPMTVPSQVSWFIFCYV